MISCIEWIPKGVAHPTPKKYEMSPAELELLEQQAELEQALAEGEEDDDEEEEEEKGESSSTQLPTIDPSTLPPELRMDEYSDTEDDNNEAVQGSTLGQLLLMGDDTAPQHQEDEDHPVPNYNDDDDSDSDDDLADVPDTREFMPTDVAGLEAMGIGHAGGGRPTITSRMMNNNNGDDVMGDYNSSDDDDDDGSDVEDTRISPNDALVVVAKTEDDFAALEVCVYEESMGNLYVHHDIPLPSFPLCMAQGDVDANGNAGNFIAVGTFEPGIEIWNLDVLNVLEPSFTLGGQDNSSVDELMKLNMMRAASGGKKNKAKQKLLQQQPPSKLLPGSHTDAVMALSWNKIHRQVIASGSADMTVKLWDVTKTSGNNNAATFTHHKGKVQAVEWHPTDGTLLATGSYDRNVALVDARSANNNNAQCKKVKISADIESLRWDPHRTEYLTAASEDGMLVTWDVRKFDKPVWSLLVDEFGGVTDFSYNTHVPGMMVTSSVNKTVTLWDCHGNSKQDQQQPEAPIKCGNKSMQVGKLYAVSFYQSSPWLMGCGGSGNELALWDMTREDSIQKRFSSRLITTNNDAAVDQEEAEQQEPDFEAIISTTDKSMEEARTKAADNNSKKKKSGQGKKKRKPHRKGR